MALVLTEDQKLLKQSAADFAKKESPVGRVRALRDDSDSDGFSRELWQKMGALGWPAIVVPEQYGGLGMGFTELACVVEELGRTLAPEPLLSSSVLGAVPLILAGSEEQKAQLLPQIAEGSLLVTFAYQERGMRHRAAEPARVATRAVGKGGGFVVSGEKILVMDGHVADKLLVSARTSDDAISVFLIDRNAPGVEVVRQSTVDSRNAALVRLNDVEVAATDAVGDVSSGAATVAAVLERAAVALSAEMLGAMQAAFEMTLEYLKTRKQFGVPIGSFQALKHRAAQMFIEIELAKSSVLGACDAIDGGAESAAALASVAKARCSDAALLIGHESVQMHGGIGMTDEHDIGFYLKRARASEVTFGDAAFHRDRYANLNGY